MSISLLLAAVSLVTLPATRFVQTDQSTSIPVTVRISSFAVGATEVTQKEFEAVMGYNPSLKKGENLPVHNITWWEAVRYVNALSVREGLEPTYDLRTGVCDRSRNGYRLPTDAEWSYAAGAAPARGNTSSVNMGPSQTKDAAALVEWARSHGPADVTGLPADARGLRGMYGNVWEWVGDFNDVAGAVGSAVDPAGPATGVARVLRGGSYLTSTSSWGKNYRSSLEPDRRSPFAGLRVCRTVAAYGKDEYPADWFGPYQAVPSGFAGQTGPLRKFDKSAWEGERAAVVESWQRVLGSPSTGKPAVEARLLQQVDTSYWRSRILQLRVEEDYWEKIQLFLPHTAARRPLPVVIVPYYDVDTPAGINEGGRLHTPLGTRAFAHLAVQQGFAGVAIRWFGESYAENYAEAVAALKLKHPQLTGLGKWVWDSKRLLDYLEMVPEVDKSRIGIIGHSLGGKMALYAAAFDPRIKAVVSSELGIGLKFSNYEDFWYLGENIRGLKDGQDHHELLAMIAPRPFLLIGGDSSDNDKSWYYINSVKPLYGNDPDRVAYFNHRTGHSPTPQAVHMGMEWLRRFLLE
ncbi:MAG: SUMF1/EgtB/PvdO family nonheme iron enzyme [Bryobacterales bacterium]|nr:SUMF1/EgtB/PvdO family nonheme iron enzyme [Bryobacterales bacterium]